MKFTYTKGFMYLLFLVVLFTSSRQSAQAQVKIGTSNDNINQGASLEVESGPYPGNIYRGLLFPRVALTDYGTWSLTGTPTDGMVVFNTATTTGTYPVTPGIYCWYNYQWNRQSPEILTKIAQITSVDCLPGVAATGVFDYDLDLSASYPYLKQAKQISVVPATSGTYQFVAGPANSIYFRGSGTFIPSQIGTPQIVNLTPSGTVGSREPTTFSVLNANTNFSSVCNFTLIPTIASDCSGTLSGTYKVNIPFDASNTKQITFTPPLAGDYKFSADASIISGRFSTLDFTFSQTVTFSADQVAKPQSVTLVAISKNGSTGGPTASNTYRPTLKIAGPYYSSTASPPTGINYANVCQFDVTVTP